MRIKVTMSVETPQVPNFMRLTDGQAVPICSVTDEALRRIGAAWTDALIARAYEQHRAHYGKERNEDAARVSEEGS